MRCSPRLLDPTIYTPATLAAFDRLQAPVWIVDLDRGAQWWANLACLPIFHADSREALIARSGRTTPSEASRTRLELLRRGFARGERSLDRWTLYPEGGQPFVAECRSSGIWIADRDGRVFRIGIATPPYTPIAEAAADIDVVLKSWRRLPTKSTGFWLTSDEIRLAPAARERLAAQQAQAGK